MKRVCVGAILGFFIGVIIPMIPIFFEFFRRLNYAWSGGKGETANWGEPLFYLPLLPFAYAYPYGLIGILVGAFLFPLILFLLKK